MINSLYVEFLQNRNVCFLRFALLISQMEQQRCLQALSVKRRVSTHRNDPKNREGPYSPCERCFSVQKSLKFRQDSESCTQLPPVVHLHNLQQYFRYHCYDECTGKLNHSLTYTYGSQIFAFLLHRQVAQSFANLSGVFQAKRTSEFGLKVW